MNQADPSENYVKGEDPAIWTRDALTLNFIMIFTL